MSEPAQKCKNNSTVFKQKYAQNLCIAFKLAIFWQFLMFLLDTLDFLQLEFYNINHWPTFLSHIFLCSKCAPVSPD